MTARESIFEELRRIPEDLHEINERLENWAKWSKDRLRKNKCRSIEGRYTSPQTWDSSEPRITWDSLAAEALHSVVCGLPEKQRWIVHLHYVHGAPEGYIRRKLAIRRDEIVAEVWRAVRMVRNVSRGV